MRKLLLLPLLIIPITACGSLAVATDPTTGEAVVVDTTTGEKVDVVASAQQMASGIGSMFGIPGLGPLAGAAAALVAGGYISRKAKKKTPTVS